MREAIFVNQDLLAELEVSDMFEAERERECVCVHMHGC
jgi:hypothetical protein